LNKKVLLVLINLLISILLIFQAACNGITPAPTFPPIAPPGLSGIGNILQNALKGRIAYNAPAAMQLDQTLDIQLLLSPSLGEEELKQKIVEMGQIMEAEIQITPLMKADLKSDDPQAFAIQAFHDSPEQVVLTDAPTEWRWSLTAKKSGDRFVTLTLYRQVDYNGQFYWTMVETYKNSIHITVSPKQRWENFDWKWLAGILLTAILIPAMWRLIDRSNKKKKAARKAGSR